MTMDHNPTVIQLENVSRVFLTDELQTYALCNVSIKIEKGEFLSINGPSGSGKTTLLSILGLLDTPTAGDYFLRNHKVANLTMEELAKIRNREVGFIFQSYDLVGHLSVYENVELPLTYRGMTASYRKKLVVEALRKVDMKHYSTRYPNQLSGGQQQRVAVARALAGRPQILLADEPTGNLDSKNGESVMNLLRELNEEGSTVCMVTHDNRYSNFATRTIELFDGQIVE